MMVVFVVVGRGEEMDELQNAMITMEGDPKSWRGPARAGNNNNVDKKNNKESTMMLKGKGRAYHHQGWRRSRRGVCANNSSTSTQQQQQQLQAGYCYITMGIRRDKIHSCSGCCQCWAS